MWTSPKKKKKKIVTNLHSGQKKTKALSCKFRNKFVPLQARWETYIITMTKIEQGQKVRLFAFFFGLFSLFFVCYKKMITFAYVMIFEHCYY